MKILNDMNSIKNDPVINIIYEGIVSPIKVLMDKGHMRAALQLTFCGIDAMTYLSLEATREDSNRKDYAAWCDRYIKLNTQDKITGLELFASRSGLVHNYKTESKMSKEGRVRALTFFHGQGPDTLYAPEDTTEEIMVRIPGLIEAFYNAVDEFIVDVFEKYPERTEERLGKMLSMQHYE